MTLVVEMAMANNEQKLEKELKIQRQAKLKVFVIKFDGISHVRY